MEKRRGSQLRRLFALSKASTKLFLGALVAYKNIQEPMDAATYHKNKVNHETTNRFKEKVTI